MNNRGKKLSYLELLKNRLIYLTSLFSDDDVGLDDRTQLRKSINDAWQEIYHQLGKNKSHRLPDDDFLKAHWIMYFKYSRKRGNDYITFLLDTQFSPKRIYKKTYSDTEKYSEDLEIKAFEEDAGLETEEETSDEQDQDIVHEKIDLSEINAYVFSLKESAKHWFNTFNPDLASLDNLEKNH